MFNLVPFRGEHLEPLKRQRLNAYLPDWIKAGSASEMEKTYAFTGFVRDEVQVCGGITELWPGRGSLWSIFSETCKHNFIPTFRGIKRFLNEAPFQRIEMCVPVDFAIGHRRAEMLGFTLECSHARRYLPDGQDCALYSMIKLVGIS